MGAGFLDVEGSEAAEGDRLRAVGATHKADREADDRTGSNSHGDDTSEFVTMAAIRFILPAPSTWS
jgi:hypothetical protein